jgi:hypothetical protein
MAKQMGVEHSSLWQNTCHHLSLPSLSLFTMVSFCLAHAPPWLPRLTRQFV